NDLVNFADAQATASNNGTVGAIGRDSVLRGLRSSLRDALLGAHGTGTFTRLAEIGLGFTRTGQLTLDQDKLTEALDTDPAAVQSLFADSTTGVFGSVNSLLDEYTDAGGFLPDAQTRLTDELSRLGRQIDDMSAQLAIRRAALQQEFTAADQAMAQLNSQKSSLSSFSNDLVQANISSSEEEPTIMSALAARGIDSYRQNDIQARSPLELVVMLYDGALRFTSDARDAIVRRDIRSRQQHLSRAMAIVSELQSTLDMETGGEVAEHLDKLYGFVRDRLIDASVNQDLQPLDEARRVLTTLREGWLAISRASATAAATSSLAR